MNIQKSLKKIIRERELKKEKMKFQNKFLVFAVLILSIFLVSQFIDFTITGYVIAYDGNNTVYQCGDIDQAGTYTINQSLTTTTTCLTINVSDVSLDCQNFNIDGDDGASDYGINVSGSSGAEFTNITLNNCNITDFNRGISFDYTNTSVIDNITSNSNTYGIYLTNSNSSNITNLNLTSNSLYGILLSNSDSNNLINITANLNTNYGILLNFADSNTFTNITANSNNQRGIFLGSGSDSNILTNITANSNTNYGIFLSQSNSNTLTNITANSNSDRGIYLNSNSDSNTFTNITANSNGNYGFYIDASNLNNFTNITANSNNQRGIFLDTSDSNTFTNITANSNGQYGIFLDTSDSNTFTNLTANSNSNSGIYLFNADSNTFESVNLINNTQWDFFTDANTATECNNQLTNITGTDNKPIYYTNETVNLQDWNNNASLIILCDADNSVLNNITMSHVDKENNGILLTGTSNSNLTNLNINDSNYGIYLASSNSNNLTNITANSNLQNGIFLISSSTSNTLTNITANSNNNHGISLASSSNSNTLTNITANSNLNDGFSILASSNTLTNITASSNTDDGIFLDGNSNKVSNSTIESQSGSGDKGIHIDDDNNIIENTVIKSNYDGIYLDNSADNNTIVNVTFESNSNAGIYFNSAGLNTPNLFYNNLFNNTNNINFAGTIYTNYWNTTQQTGDRIYSPGTQIGGNYWTNSTGNGFSDTCTDANGNGFCDDGYNVTNDVACTVGVNCSINTDYLAYSDEWVDPFNVFVCKTIDSPGVYTMNQSLSGIFGTCLTINASDISLDCKNFNLDGDSLDVGFEAGIFADGALGADLTNITISNCNVTDFVNGIYFENTNTSIIDNTTANSNSNTGIYLQSSDSNTLIDITANSNTQYGVFFDSFSTSNKLENSTLLNNTQWDFFTDGDEATECNNQLTNITGTDNKPIYYTNETVTLEHWNNNASAIILCDADNSVLNNITMSHTDVENNGILLTGTSNSNLTNISVSDSYNGISLSDTTFSTNSNLNTLTNITANSNSGKGIYLSGANSNNLTSITANSNTDDGIHLFGSDSNNLINVTTNSNTDDGIVLNGNSNKVINSTVESQSGSNSIGIFISAYNNTIENVTIKSNYQGIYLDGFSDNNTIVNNTIENNTNSGIYSFSTGQTTPNLIYNNLFNNTNNVILAGTVYTNYWNTTKQSGNRIFSDGTQIGGNYWTNSTGNGFSDTCVDADVDGFCDDGYNVTNDVACTVGVNCSITNTDYLAYSDEYFDSNVSVCKTLDTSGNYKVINDLSTTGTCITITSSDVSLDCDNFNIDGDDGSGDYGIFSDGALGSELTNISINNCNVTDFDLGIYFDYTNTSVIDNITSNSNSQTGIQLGNSDSNNLTNIISNSNGFYGFHISGSDSNTLTNITSNSNSQTGIRLSGTTDSNTFINITSNSNGLYGIRLDGNSNKVSNSTFQFQSGSNDAGIFIDDDHNIIENVIIKSNYRGISLDANTDNNTIVNNTIENSSYGIYLDFAGLNTPNLIYNNLLNNTNNVFFTGTIFNNFWNTTKQDGVRIYSSGTQIGGNYWTNSTGNGFSDTCTDSNSDDFCDDGYNVTNDVACTVGVNCSITNTDFLAYSAESIEGDTTNPTAVYTCLPLTVFVGDKVTCTCTGTDSDSGVDTTSSPTTIIVDEGGIFTISGCTVTDNAGNSASATGSYTVIGGGGGITPGEGEPTLQKTHLLVQVKPGEEISMSSFGGTGVKEIVIEVNQELQNVRIKVSKYDSKPASVSVENSGKIYRYLEISTENLQDSLEKATVRFEVEKIWVSDRGLDKDDLTIFKFDNNTNKWNSLQTSFDGEDDNFYFYKIELDSFSFFAIGEKLGIPIISDIIESYQIETKLGLILWWSIFGFLLIGIVVLSVLIVREIRKKKREAEFNNFNAGENFTDKN